MVPTDPAPQDERRAGERRRYNRRQPPSVTPPYYEAFERIASALETISAALTGPAAEGAPKPKGRKSTAGPVAPRGSGEGTTSSEDGADS